MARRIPRTPANLARHELIGLAVEVVGSTDPSEHGLSGRVVDETLGTFVVEGPDGAERQIAKEGRTFRFDLEGRAVELAGDDLAHRPRDRTKKAPHRPHRPTRSST